MSRAVVTTNRRAKYTTAGTSPNENKMEKTKKQNKKRYLEIYRRTRLGNFRPLMIRSHPVSIEMEPWKLYTHKMYI